MFVEAQELKWLEISTCKRTEHFEPSSICRAPRCAVIIHGAPNQRARRDRSRKPRIPIAEHRLCRDTRVG